MNQFSDRPVVNSREELIDLIFALLDDNDAIEWENDSAYSYLQALAAWLANAESFYNNIGEAVDFDKITWQIFADALQAATNYE